MRPLIDAHLDLAWNALYFNRDLLATVAEVRTAEQGMTDELARGGNTLTLPELRRAIDGIFFGNWLRFFGDALPDNAQLA